MFQSTYSTQNYTKTNGGILHVKSKIIDSPGKVFDKNIPGKQRIQQKDRKGTINDEKNRNSILGVSACPILIQHDE